MRRFIKCDDFMDDFGEETDINFEDLEFVEEETISDDMDNEIDETGSDDCAGLGWEEVAFLGAMSEQIADEKEERRRLRKQGTGSGIEDKTN